MVEEEGEDRVFLCRNRGAKQPWSEKERNLKKTKTRGRAKEGAQVWSRTVRRTSKTVRWLPLTITLSIAPPKQLREVWHEYWKWRNCSEQPRNARFRRWKLAPSKWVNTEIMVFYCLEIGHRYMSLCEELQWIRVFGALNRTLKEFQWLS